VAVADLAGSLRILTGYVNAAHTVLLEWEADLAPPPPQDDPPAQS